MAVTTAASEHLARAKNKTINHLSFLPSFPPVGRRKLPDLDDWEGNRSRATEERIGGVECFMPNVQSLWSFLYLF